MVDAPVPQRNGQDPQPASPSVPGASAKARLADSLALTSVGWCFFWTDGQKLLPGQAGSDKALLLLATLLSFAVLGAFLSTLLAPLARRGAPGHIALWAVRLLALIPIGKYTVPKFVDGCSSGLAVVSFCVFLVLVLRSLDDSGDSVFAPSSLLQRESSAAEPAPGGQEVHRGPVVAPRVTGKLQQVIAMATSGLLTGFLAGTGRAALGVQELDPNSGVFCLFPLSVIAVGVLVRLLCARVIQGRGQLARGKIWVTVIDGLIVGTLLAIVTSTKLPEGVWWDGTRSRSQLPWILIGVTLGFTWGVVFGSIKSLVSKSMQFRLGSAFATGAQDSRTPAPPETSSSAGPSRPEPGTLLKAGLERAPSPAMLGQGGRQADPKAQPAPPPKRSATRNACSCLAAPMALGSTLFFAFLASRGCFQFEKERSDIALLPQGCPPACAGAPLDRFKLAGVDFSNANLRGAKLRDADLDGANLRGADLTDALLFQAHLRKADLSGADLSGADLRSTILLEARLENTRLRGAYLRNATLQDLDLSTTDLRGADLRKAVYTSKTKWPPGFDIGKAGLRLDD